MLKICHEEPFPAFILTTPVIYYSVLQVYLLRPGALGMPDLLPSRIEVAMIHMTGSTNDEFVLKSFSQKSFLRSSMILSGHYPIAPNWYS